MPSLAQLLTPARPLPPAPPTGSARLLTTAPTRAREAVAFLLVGAATTLAYLVLYAALRGTVGDQGANAAALVLTAGANTAANRRLSFGVRGRADAWRHQAQGLVVFGVTLALTSGALAALDAAGATDTTLREAVLVGANVVAGTLHFALLRTWVFRR